MLRLANQQQNEYFTTDLLLQKRPDKTKISNWVGKPASCITLLQVCFDRANELFERRSNGREAIRAAFNRLQDVLTQVNIRYHITGAASHQINLESNNGKMIKWLYHLACGALCLRQAMVEAEWQPLSVPQCYEAQRHFEEITGGDQFYWLAQLFSAKCHREINRNEYQYFEKYEDCTDVGTRFCEIFLRVPKEEKWGVHIALDALINMGRCLQNCCLYEQAVPYHETAVWILQGSKKKFSTFQTVFPPLESGDDYHVRAEELKDAISSFNDQSDSDFEDQLLQAKINLLICYIEGYQDYDTAEEIYQSISEIGPDNIDAKNNLGRMYYKQWKYDDAIAKFNDVIDATPPLDASLSRNHRFAKLEKVKCHIKLRQFAKAAKLLSKLQKAYPMDEEIQLWQAIWYRNQKQLQPAIDILEKICSARLPIRRGTIMLKAHFVIGTCYLEWDKPAQAYQYFEKIHQAVPDDIAAVKNLGWCRQMAGEYAEAIESYQSICNTLAPMVQTGEKAASDVDAAKYQLAPRVRYDLVSTYNNLGHCHICRTEYVEALQAFCNALYWEPFNNLALCCAAHCLRHLGSENSNIGSATLSQKSLSILKEKWDAHWKTDDSRAKWLSDLQIPEGKVESASAINNQKIKVEQKELLELAIDLASLAQKNANDDWQTSSEYVLCLSAVKRGNGGEEDVKVSQSLRDCLHKHANHPMYCLEALIALGDFVESEALKSNTDHAPQNQTAYLNQLANYADYASVYPAPEESCYEQVMELIDSREYATLNDAQKGKLLRHIYQLHHKMDQIKNELRVICSEGEAIPQFRHYTSLGSLKALLATNNETPPRFRLFNVSGVNDSSEGEPLLYLLRRNGGKITSQAASGTDSGCSKQKDEIPFEEILQRFGLQFGSQEDCSGLRNVYITSLCSVTDYIYMWVIYADKGAGCNVLFGKHFFDVTQKLVPNFIPYFAGTSRYPLYKIQYIEETNAEKDYGLSHSVFCLIGDLAQELCAIEDALHDCPTDICMPIRQRITNMLDQVRYLFKYDEYCGEEEVRCVVVTSSSKVDESAQVPRLYTEIENDITFDEVCLGPKAAQVPETEAWLYSTGRVARVTRSKRHYR